MDKFKDIFHRTQLSDLFEAIRKGETEKVLKIVKSHPEKLQEVDQQGRDLTFAAAAANNKELVMAFIAQGIDASATTRGGQKLKGSALHAACGAGHLELLQALRAKYPDGMSVSCQLRDTIPVEEALIYGQFSMLHAMAKHDLLDLKQLSSKHLNVLGLALACYVNHIIDECDAQLRHELEEFILYLLDTQKMDPFADTSGWSIAAIDVFLMPDQAIKDASNPTKAKLTAASASARISEVIKDETSQRVAKKLLRLAEQAATRGNKKAQTFFKTFAQAETSLVSKTKS